MKPKIRIQLPPRARVGGLVSAYGLPVVGTVPSYGVFHYTQRQMETEGAALVDSLQTDPAIVDDPEVQALIGRLVSALGLYWCHKWRGLEVRPRVELSPWGWMGKRYGDTYGTIVQPVDRQHVRVSWPQGCDLGDLWTPWSLVERETQDPLLIRFFDPGPVPAVPGCQLQQGDGCCGHPDAPTPECHSAACPLIPPEVED